MAYALHAVGKDVQQQAPDEFFAVHVNAPLAAVGVGAHREDHLVSVDGLDALVADGRAVGVATQVLKHLRRPAQGRLGIDHPGVAVQRLAAVCAQQGAELVVLRGICVRSPLHQRGHEPGAEDRAECAHREQEVRLAHRSAPPAIGPQTPQAITA